MEKNHYFQSYAPYFWQWEEEGNVVSIPGGSTIAYKAFIQELLPVFEFQGLPPFGAFLLAIIATNRNGKQQLAEIREIVTGDMLNDSEYTAAISFLDLLTTVPETYKTGRLKAQLFRTIFDRCHGIGPYRKTALLNIQFTVWKDIREVMHPKEIIPRIVKKDFRVFSVLASKFNSVEQLLAKMTDLPEIAEELQLIEPTVEQVEHEQKAYVDELIENERTEYIGKLVCHLWGGLSIPFHSSLPSNQPLGGISDLTNKGDFDRLLISEFANDDLVFLSRLANNEALYIQREIPPQHNNLERVFLIDSSIKTWGNPKTIAFAIMVAIASHPKTDIPCKGYVIGEEYLEVNPLSTLSIINALSQLSAELSCARGITAFLADFPPRKNREVFVITEESTLKSPSMLAVLHENHSSIDYWVYTDAHGKVDIYKKQQHSKRLIQHLNLPLETLWKKEKPVKPTSNQANYEGNFPILFPPTGVYKYVHILHESTCLLISNDNKCFTYTEEIRESLPEGPNFNTNTKGLELVHPNLPFCGQIALGKNTAGEHLLAIANVDKNEFWSYNLITKEEKKGFFDKNSITNGDFYFKEGSFWYFSYKGNWEIPCDTMQVTLNNNKELINESVSIRKQMEAEQVKFPRLITDRNVYKNMDFIAVSEQNNLVFGKNELTFNRSSNTIKIRPRQDMRIKFSAEYVGGDTFEFKDGSAIEVNRSGMLILRSSSPKIPTIFVPSVLVTKIGVATYELCAGDSFFLKDQDVLTVKAFQEQFIHPFITTIITYGA